LSTSTRRHRRGPVRTRCRSHLAGPRAATGGAGGSRLCGRGVAALPRQPRAVLTCRVRLPARDAVPRSRPPTTDHRPPPAPRQGHRLLSAYARRLDAEILTGSRLTWVRRVGDVFEVDVEGGDRLSARASWRPPGRSDTRTGPRCRAWRSTPARCRTPPHCRSPAPFADRRVVGAGNSAVQISVELAKTARVTLATVTPVKFAARRVLGHDLRFWLARTGLGTAPSAGSCRARRRSRSSTTAATGPPSPPDGPSGERCSPAPAEPSPSGQTGSERKSTRSCSPPATTADLPESRRPRRSSRRRREPPAPRSLATSVPGPAFVGLERQRSLSSNSLRGAGRDADRVARRVAACLACQ
jgi:putative flavoprotein involved in K+ transport